MVMQADNYLLRNSKKIARIVKDPVAAWARFYDRMDYRIEYARPPCTYHPDRDWERHLHERIGVDFPCDAVAEFHELWPRIAALVAAKGYQFGPESYLGWNDGDPELVRAAWCLVRHLRPTNVVETGVGHGVTTRFILEALERNGHGKLWSIDLPPSNEAAAAQVAIAVDGFAPERWQLLRGTSRRYLPGLLATLDEIDLFIHDSLHTRRNVCFEVEQAKRHLTPGGFIVIDDIDTNWGFHALSEAGSADRLIVCQSEPVHPDHRRFDDRGLFGVIQTSSR